MEVLTNVKIYKDCLVSIEVLECSAELDKCLGHVGWVLSKIEEAKNGMYSTYKPCGRKSTTKGQTNDETKEKARNLCMLLASNLLKHSDALHK